MNVLQLISSSLGYYGAERVVITLSAAVLEEMGVNTVVGAFRNTAKTSHLEVLEQAESRGLATVQIACHGRLDRQAVVAIRDIVERHKIDVTHCHGIKPDLYALLALSRSVTVVSTCHLWTFDSPKEWALSALERCILHASDRVVAVSDHIVPQLRRFGVRADVIYNGVDLEPFNHSGSNFKRSMNWSGRPVIGAMGRLAPQKGLQYLLRAAPEVLRDSPKAVFAFVGDGPERELLEAEARSLNIQDAVCFLGVRHDIPELLSSMDVLAMPSLSEGLPMALLEAMASGRAVVASGVGAIPHVIQDRVNGIILPPRDVKGLAAALRYLLEDSELRIALGQNARQTVESRFSAASMAKRYLELYREATLSKGQSVRAQ